MMRQRNSAFLKGEAVDAVFRLSRRKLPGRSCTLSLILFAVVIPGVPFICCLFCHLLGHPVVKGETVCKLFLGGKRREKELSTKMEAILSAIVSNIINLLSLACEINTIKAKP